MRIVSVNVGQPRRVQWRGLHKTSIFKFPVEGPVEVKTLNLAGDRQADLSVHGGPRKAVYVYPHEHYSYWHEVMPGYAFSPANFGENLTIEGLLEDAVFINDRLRIGSAVFVVTQPRTPCYKLQVRFERPDMTKLFWDSRRFGFYLAVEQEGVIESGQAIEVVHDPENTMTIAHAIGLITGDVRDAAIVRQPRTDPTGSKLWS
jgi:MOSC domain-containing protein YiiM